MPVGFGPDAAVFDLDGVITFTAHVHAAAWKQLFDEYLGSRSRRFGEPFRPFDADADYRAFVDGKPRYEGVRSFLESRGIRIPYGSPADSPEQETICGLGNRKDLLFEARLQEVGVEVDREAVRFVRELRARGTRVGLASSSKNAVPILESVGLRELFDAVVDGVVSERVRLKGKPDPDIFLYCLALLLPDADPRRALIAEDAVAGVQAGRSGGFGLVLGVDRHGEPQSLLENGADRVVSDFRQISADAVIDFFRERARSAG